MAPKERGLERDPELQAMLQVFAALKDLQEDAQIRVIAYVEGRLSLRRPARDAAHPRQRTEASPEPARGDDVVAVPAETAVTEDSTGNDDDGDGKEELEGISPVAQKWMRRNDLKASVMAMLFSLGVDDIDLVAKKVPGKNTNERLRNVLLLLGIAAYLSGGTARIDNKKLKDAALHYNADAANNFAKYLKTWASEISGSRSSGDLTLTTRGLTAARDLIRAMTEAKVAS